MVDLALEKGFSASTVLTFCAKCFFLVGDCSVHCKMFSSITGLYSLNDCSTPLPVVATQSVFKHCQMCLGGQNQPQLKTTALKKFKSSGWHWGVNR